MGKLRNFTAAVLSKKFVKSTFLLKKHTVNFSRNADQLSQSESGTESNHFSFSLCRNSEDFKSLHQDFETRRTPIRIETSSTHARRCLSEILNEVPPPPNLPEQDFKKDFDPKFKDLAENKDTLKINGRVAKKLKVFTLRVTTFKHFSQASW